jgi:hypothetical protein
MKYVQKTVQIKKCPQQRSASSPLTHSLLLCDHMTTPPAPLHSNSTVSISESDLKKEKNGSQSNSHTQLKGDGELVGGPTSLKSPRNDQSNGSDTPNPKPTRDEEIKGAPNLSQAQADTLAHPSSDNTANENNNLKSPRSSSVENSLDKSTAPKSWERVWTLEELRQATHSWTLASDLGVIYYFSFLSLFHFFSFVSLFTFISFEFEFVFF